MRTIVDIPEDDIRWLDARAAATGKSRTALVREAVEAYRADTGDEAARRRAALNAGFGAWKHRTDIGDAVEWQRRERAANTRPWDFDYPEVRAEFPDLFDEYDDREHELWKAARGGTDAA
jgi:Arc/MetJ-type ribon-helix-helix transcriptional regulator